MFDVNRLTSSSLKNFVGNLKVQCQPFYMLDVNNSHENKFSLCNCLFLTYNATYHK